MGGLAQPRGVPVFEAVPDGRELTGKAGPERLNDPLKRLGIVSADGHQDAGVHQLLPWSIGRRADTHDAVDRRPEFREPDGLGQEVVHAGREAALPVFTPGSRRQRDDGQMAAGRLLPLPDFSDDLETVQARHVDVEEQ